MFVCACYFYRYFVPTGQFKKKFLQGNTKVGFAHNLSVFNPLLFSDFYGKNSRNHRLHRLKTEKSGYC